MTPLAKKLQELKEIGERATPGPWRAGIGYCDCAPPCSCLPFTEALYTEAVRVQKWQGSDETCFKEVFQDIWASREDGVFAATARNNWLPLIEALELVSDAQQEALEWDGDLSESLDNLVANIAKKLGVEGE